MATRTRGKRPQDVTEAPSPPAKRSRGGRGQRQPEDGTENDAATTEGGPVSHRIASRRGAPKFSQTGSIASLATPGRELENEESEEDDILAAQIEVMKESLPELSAASEKLIAHLRNPERDSARYQYRLKVRRNAFYAQHKTFEEPEDATFIDGDLIEDIGQNSSTSVASVLDSANLASALDIVEAIQSEEEPDLLNLLIELDDFFPKLATTQSPQMALDIRTLRLIEEQDQRKTKAELNKTIAAVFCDVPDVGKKADYAKLFANGPFRPLDHEDEEDEETGELRYNRIQEIMAATKDVKKGNGASQLRETFPLENTMYNLHEFLILAVDSRPPVARAAEEEFHDAAEQLENGSQAESQPIQRLGKPQPSFFKGASSLSALGRIGEHLSPVPPSNQQQDDDTNSAFLGPRPASVAEDDDAFQEDSRPVDRRRSAAISKALAQAAPPQPSSSMPPPPRPTIPPTQQSPPTSSFEAIQQQKQRVTQQHRAKASSIPPSSGPSSQQPDTPSYKQRQPWSAHDCDLLIRLIAQHHAAWSIIQNAHNAQFDHPRHQQAYRDKARNMKVDFLLTDAVLPPNFDLVALGKKEVERLITFGKNPYRRENDVDDAGNAVNCEYVR